MAETFRGETRAENRRFPRQKLKLWVHFIRLKENQEKSGKLESLTEDLGAGGIAMRSDHKLENGEVLALTLFLPPEDKRTDPDHDLIYSEEECLPVDIQARVRWCAPREDLEYILGVEFLQVRGEHRERLKTFLVNYNLAEPETKPPASRTEATDTYKNLAYYSPERLGQYYYQVKAVREAGAKKVLEIGIGPGVVTHMLKKAGVNVITCDQADDLTPDVCGDIRELPLEDNVVDFVLCCQVLEHLPFDDFPRALAELKRVTRDKILISIPYASRSIYCQYKLPGGRRNSWVLHFPCLPPKGEMAPGHLWEQGRRGYSKRKIKEAIVAAGLRIQSEFTPVESPGNQYFLIAK